MKLPCLREKTCGNNPMDKPKHEISEKFQRRLDFGCGTLFGIAFAIVIVSRAVTELTAVWQAVVLFVFIVLLTGFLFTK